MNPFVVPRKQTTIFHPSFHHHLFLRLLAIALLRLGSSQEVPAHPPIRLAADGDARDDDGPAVPNNAILAVALLLLAEDAQDVLAALGALAQGEQHELAAVVVQLAGGLLDGREARVERRERRVAERVGLLHVRRHEAVGPREVGEEGLQARERGAGQGEGLGAVGVGLEGGDGVGDEGVGGEVLRGVSQIAEERRKETKKETKKGRRTLRKAEAGASPLTCGSAAIVEEGSAWGMSSRLGMRRDGYVYSLEYNSEDR